jgi:hypothetical protein
MGAFKGSAWKAGHAAIMAGLMGACASGARADEAKPSAVFSGLPAEVGRKAGWFGDDAVVPCIVFSVRLPKPSKAPRLTTNGFGPSRLSPASDRKCPPANDSHWQADIALMESTEVQPVALWISNDVVTDGIEKAKGKIEAYGAEGVLGGTDLTVTRIPKVQLWPAFTWFLGFVLPAFGVYWVTRITEWRAAVRKEKQGLAVFRTVQKPKVDKLVDDVVTVLRGVAEDRRKQKNQYTNAGLQVLQSLQTHAIIEQLPSWAREKVIRCCEANRLAPVTRELIRCFPTHAETLRPPGKEAGFRIWGRL